MNINLEKTIDKSFERFLFPDDHSIGLREVIGLFTRKRHYRTGHLRKATNEALGFNLMNDLESENFVYLDRLEIVKKHRGRGVGIY